LDDLPSIGEASAKKIIAARPYKSVDDLSKAGLSQKQLETITPLVAVSGTAAAKEKTAAGASHEDTESTEARVPPSPGMVWVNTESKVYHKEGDPWYGKTKHGKFMNESDAIKEGDHLSGERSSAGENNEKSKESGK
jgi:hypothetical protein